MVHKTKRLPSWIEDDNVHLDMNNYVWLVERALESSILKDKLDTKEILKAELDYMEKKNEENW